MAGILSIPFSKSLLCTLFLFFSFSLTLFSLQLGIITQEIEFDGLISNSTLEISAVIDRSLAKGVLFEKDIILQADLIKDKHLNQLETILQEDLVFPGITVSVLSELLKDAGTNDSIAFTLLRNDQLVKITFPLMNSLHEKLFLALNTPMHHSEIRDIAVNERKKLLVSCSYDKTLKIWNTEDLTLKKTLWFPADNGNPGKIVSTAISHQGDQIACSVWGSDWENGDLIFIVDTQDYQVQQVIRNLENTAFDLEFSADDRYLLAALGDCRDVMVFDTSDYHLIAQSELPSMGTNSAIFLSDASQILCVGNDGFLRLYQLENQHLRMIREKTYENINPQPFRVVYCEQNGLIALGFLNGTYLELLDSRTLETLYKPHVTPEMNDSLSLLHTLAFSDDGHSLYAGNYGADGKGDLIHWDLKNMSEPEIIPLDSGVLKIIADDQTVYFCTEWPMIGSYDTKTKTWSYVKATILDFQGGYNEFEASPDGALIKIPGDFEAPACFFDTRTAEIIEGNTLQKGLLPPLTYSTVINVENWQYSETPRCNGIPLILEEGEFSRCIAINPLETGFALGTDWHIDYYDHNGQLLWKTQQQSVVKALNIIQNGKLLIAAMGSGIVDFIRIADGVKLASLCVTKEERWAFWTEEGYYATSDHHPSLLGWVQNKGETNLSEFYPIDRFYLDFYMPFLPQIIISTLKTTTELFSDGQETEKILSVMEHHTIRLESEAPEKPEFIHNVDKTIHVILCAAEDYQLDGFAPLFFAADDVTAVEALIRKQYADEFQTILTHTLLNDDFSHEKLDVILNHIAESSGANQHIIFFYAGHGAFIQEEETYEYILKYPNTPGGLRLTKLMQGLESIQASQTTLILDACNSGAAVDYLVKNLVQKNLHNQTRQNHINVITSSKQWGKSAEIKSLGHGLFTHCLLQSMETNETLDWEKIANELLLQMKTHSQIHLGTIQFPGIYLSE